MVVDGHLDASKGLLDSRGRWSDFGSMVAFGLKSSMMSDAIVEAPTYGLTLTFHNATVLQCAFHAFFQHGIDAIPPSLRHLCHIIIFFPYFLILTIFPFLAQILEACILSLMHYLRQSPGSEGEKESLR